ncbi:MAG: MFS transporter, partial [Ruthenibacterium sp.]
ALSFSLEKLPLVPLLIVVLMLLYGISGTYQPTVQASIPALVTQENILPAGAVVNQIGALAGLLGPIIGGMLFGAFGIAPILALSIVCFFASAVMELFITIPFIKRKSDSGIFKIVKNDVRDSVHYLKTEKPMLMQIIALVAVFNLVLSAMLTVGTPVLMVNILQRSDAALGFSQGMMALGGLCGGICTALFSKKLRLAKSHLLLLSCSACVRLWQHRCCWARSLGSAILLSQQPAFSSWRLPRCSACRCLPPCRHKRRRSLSER